MKRFCHSKRRYEEKKLFTTKKYVYNNNRLIVEFRFFVQPNPTDYIGNISISSVQLFRLWKYMKVFLFYRNQRKSRLLQRKQKKRKKKKKKKRIGYIWMNNSSQLLPFDWGGWMRLSSLRNFILSRLVTKPAKWLCAQRGLRSAWASLCAQWVAKDPSFLHAGSEDSDQTGFVMMRLILFFRGYCSCLTWCNVL